MKLLLNHAVAIMPLFFVFIDFDRIFIKIFFNTGVKEPDIIWREFSKLFFNASLFVIRDETDFARVQKSPGATWLQSTLSCFCWPLNSIWSLKFSQDFFHCWWKPLYICEFSSKTIDIQKIAGKFIWDLFGKLF